MPIDSGEGGFVGHASERIVSLDAIGDVTGDGLDVIDDLAIETIAHGSTRFEFIISLEKTPALIPTPQPAIHAMLRPAQRRSSSSRRRESPNYSDVNRKTVYGTGTRSSMPSRTSPSSTSTTTCATGWSRPALSSYRPAGRVVRRHVPLVSWKSSFI
jgi:hypothetical protein